MFLKCKNLDNNYSGSKLPSFFSLSMKYEEKKELEKL